MTPEQLKTSILQYAIQGKLVEQRLEEGTGEELYQKIQEEKQKLIKEGKNKKEKPLPEITEDEIPFDIPESWRWCYVGDLFNHNTGKAMNSSVKKVDKPGAIRPFITTSNVYWNSFDFSTVKEMFFSNDEVERCTVTKGDLLMCEGGAYFGRTAIWSYDYDICFQNHIHRLRPYQEIDLMFYYYVFFFYKSMNMMKAKGTAMPGLSSITLHQMIIPLPPLTEQKRIVTKIEELLPFVDRYAVAYDKLEAFNTKFPIDMKKSILQYAIQGKLVEQIAEDGTGEVLYDKIQNEKQDLIKNGKIKKEKSLPEISDDEIPFDIPETWKWVRLDDIVRKSIKRGKSPTYTTESGTLVFAQKCNTKAGGINLELALFLDESKLGKYPEEEFMRDGDIVINSTGNGTLGRVGIYRKADNPRQLPVVPDSHVTVIRANTSVSVDYVYYVLKYYQPYMEKLGTGSTNQTELSANTVRALLFPLPPLAEQKRIAAKLEELLPYCDGLVK